MSGCSAQRSNFAQLVSRQPGNGPLAKYSLYDRAQSDAPFSFDTNRSFLTEAWPGQAARALGGLTPVSVLQRRAALHIFERAALPTTRFRVPCNHLGIQ